MFTNSDCIRERILDAALRCYKKNNLQEIRIGHIAREAKVFPITIHHYFTSLDHIATEVIFRELHRLLGLVGTRVAGDGSFSEFVVESVVVASDLVNSSVVFNLIRKNPVVFVSYVSQNSEALFSIIRDHFRSRFGTAQAAGEINDLIGFDDFINWVIHIGSASVAPFGVQSKLLREMLWQFLVPSIVRKKAIS